MPKHTLSQLNSTQLSTFHFISIVPSTLLFSSPSYLRARKKRTRPGTGRRAGDAAGEKDRGGGGLGAYLSASSPSRKATGTNHVPRIFLPGISLSLSHRLTVSALIPSLSAACLGHIHLTLTFVSIFFSLFLRCAGAGASSSGSRGPYRTISDFTEAYASRTDGFRQRVASGGAK